ncbi:DegT/DnrJ/EryC1/StrS family aminotransferase [Gramella sp. GC03-9]|uniref:DegT/DnrJ/EryC1/StrS family aminotransferase n=1 Tax=Christiangramia oceanisediminis TaxID=2920386 RepID=A0A9X2I9U4_9FLAO|nr:DegT/DnrJ/EryC1/StrS family aminotransferase [Gramella oceanisediminis]MCP9199882.1 DegT/DnrJ/EryC1/StrS family aminotransferase [Gramella oceanisediminis]
MIQVTKTFLPPKEEYEAILQQVWDSNQIANGGKLHQKLTQRLKDYLNVSNIVLTTNGTLPLQIALKTIAGAGEVITTPFSYVATASAIVWEGFKPVFVDICPEYLTIDESRIEAAITENTRAILATHVFGNPCNLEKISEIAEKYKLRVIYDAAHAFGVQYKGKSIFKFGDISTCSFHATKPFHTGEGGAMFCRDQSLFEELFYRHNFGHKGQLEFQGLGINAKMSELQAAMGMAVLPYVEQIKEDKKTVYAWYDENLDFEQIRKQVLRPGASLNYSYYPIILSNEKLLLKIEKELNLKNIFPRRYFYPSLNNLPYVRKVDMPVSESIASRILCLPLYSGLREEEVRTISRIINSNLKE